MVKMVNSGNPAGCFERAETVDVGVNRTDTSFDESRDAETDAETNVELQWKLSHLGENQREMLKEVLVKNKEVFSKNDLDIGDIPDFKMPIHLTDQAPVAAAYRKAPPHLYAEVKNFIEDMVTNGRVRESCSSWSSPIVCARKKDGALRLCVD